MPHVCAGCVGRAAKIYRRREKCERQLPPRGVKSRGKSSNMLKLRIDWAREVARTEFTLSGTLARGAVCIVVGVLAACQTPQPVHIAPILSGRSPVASAPSPSPPAVTPNPVYKVGAPYEVGGVWYYPQEQPAYDETGIASWYGIDYQGRSTANGEVFDR